MARRGNGEGTISKRKDGRWCAAVTLGRHPQTGKPKRVFFYGATRAEVAEKLTVALAGVQNGTFVEPTRVTVSQWLDVWLQKYKKPELRPTTFDSYETMIRVHLTPAIGALQLKDLRSDQLQHLYNEKTKAGLSATTVRYIHTVARMALAQAVKNGLVPRNVAEATTRPRQVKKDIQPLTLEQVSLLFKTIEADRLFPAICLEFNTGLRRGELLALRWQDINLKDETLTVRQGLVRVTNHGAHDGKRKTALVFQEPKTSSSRRTIPLSEEVLAELKRWKSRQAQEKLQLGQGYQDIGLVFCQENGTPLEPRNFTRRFAVMLQRAGLPNIRFHDARHTFATLMLELGEPARVVQQILGHSKIAMTLDTYSHVSLDMERKAAARLTEALKLR